MRRIARRATGNDADADDVVQNALIQILTKSAQWRGDAPPMAWIRRIVVNESRTLQRRRAARPAASLDALPETVEAALAPLAEADPVRAEDVPELAEEQNRVRDALEGLPSTYRVPLILQDLQGVPYLEAAGLLGISLGTFKSRLFRARAALRDLLAALERRPAATVRN
jgi:RNA polymerase sigma-70 factor (ECF subfamily)